MTHRDDELRQLAGRLARSRDTGGIADVLNHAAQGIPATDPLVELRETVQRQGFILDAVVNQIEGMRASDDAAGIGTVQPESRQAAGGQIRLSYPLPTGLGDLLVTVTEGSPEFTVTWRAPTRQRVVHTFACDEAGVDPGVVVPERPVRGAKHRMGRL